MDDITKVLAGIERGDSDAAEQLLPMVYQELRQLARARMRHERSDHTLQATALVHEAFVRLVDHKNQPQWKGRAHFFAAAAQAMRRILVDHARSKATRKRGGDLARLDIDSIQLAESATPDQMLVLDEAIDQLSSLDPLAAELVMLRYFAGLDIEQAAEVMEISTATAYRHWKYARVWLHSHLMSPSPMD